MRRIQRPRITLIQALLSRASRVTLGLIAITFLFWLAWHNRVEIAAALVNAHIGLLALAVGMGLLANYLTGLPFHLFLGQHGVNVPVRAACQLQMLAQLAKYVPGKIWSALLQAQVSGIARVGGFFFAGIDTSLFLMCMLTGLGLAFLLLVYSSFVGVSLVIVTLLITSLVASQALLARVSKRFFVRHDSPDEGDISSRPNDRSATKFFTVGIIHSATHVASIMLLLAATTNLAPHDMFIATASVLLAWVLGNLAVILPSGIGVREAAFIALASIFSLQADISTISTVAVLIRFAQIVQDLITAALLAPSLLGCSKRT